MLMRSRQWLLPLPAGWLLPSPKFDRRVSELLGALTGANGIVPGASIVRCVRTVLPCHSAVDRRLSLRFESQNYFPNFGHEFDFHRPLQNPKIYSPGLSAFA
jgi:hypothetical protein